MTTTNSTDALFANVLKNTPAPAVQAAPAPAVEVETEQDEDDETEQVAQPSELDMLKKRARLMGIAFSNNIGLEALKTKVNAKLDGEAESQEDETEEVDQANEEVVVAEASKQSQEPAQQQETEQAAPVTRAAPLTRKQAEKSARKKMQEEQLRLIRCRITNLNPAKKNLPGEIFTFGNRVLGAIKKFVPYGEATENGYHIPFCIYTQLKERQFLNIKTRKDSRGRTIVETGMAREFAIEVLPALTERELAQLAAAQAAAAGAE